MINLGAFLACRNGKCNWCSFVRESLALSFRILTLSPKPLLLDHLTYDSELRRTCLNWQLFPLSSKWSLTHRPRCSSRIFPLNPGQNDSADWSNGLFSLKNLQCGTERHSGRGQSWATPEAEICRKDAAADWASSQPWMLKSSIPLEILQSPLYICIYRAYSQFFKKALFFVTVSDLQKKWQR